MLPIPHKRYKKVGLVSKKNLDFRSRNCDRSCADIIWFSNSNNSIALDRNSQIAGDRERKNRNGIIGILPDRPSE